MKFLSSVLILAGLIALNYALPSFDDQMRILNGDQPFIEELKQKMRFESGFRGRSVQTRDAALTECNDAFLGNLTIIVQILNEAENDCEVKKKNITDEVNRSADEKWQTFNENKEVTCQDDCGSELSGLSKMECLQDQASKSAKVFSGMSIESTSFVTLAQREIESAKGIYVVCIEECNRTYKLQAVKLFEDLAACKQVPVISES